MGEQQRRWVLWLHSQKWAANHKEVDRRACRGTAVKYRVETGELDDLCMHYFLKHLPKSHEPKYAELTV